MHLSQHTHLPKKLASVRALLGASLLALSPVLSWAQTTYTTSQNFEPANRGGNYRFVASSSGTGAATYFTGSTDSRESPASTPRYVASTSGVIGNSFGIENTAAAVNNIATAQLDFRNVELTNPATATTLTIRFAVIATNNNGGLDESGSIVVSINPDSVKAPNYYQPVLTIKGTGNGSGNNWSFSNNNALLPATAGYNAPRVYEATSQTSTHYTQLQINLNSAALSQAKVRVTLNASPKTILLIDDAQISSSSPLPVELVRFTAEAQEKNVALHWITASEKNSDYFEVQRGTNGETFTAIGKVQGEGTTSSISNYLFTDRTPVAGLAYYRLRQVDLDGTESYSPVQTVEWKGKLTASFYPNPSAESITLTGASGLVHYRIYSVKGQQMADGEAESGSTVNLKTVPAGMYLLELNHGGQRSVQRFVRL